MKPLVLFTALLVPAISFADEITAKFAPPEGKVLVFAGQDNESVGGTAKYRDGYVDNVGIPGGITHYVYFSEGWTNKFDRTFAKGTIGGLNTEIEWAAGPMDMKAYVDSPLLDRCVMHLSISMEGNGEDKLADGSADHLIDELVKFVGDHSDHPFLIRIGYEFDGKWNGYDAENFKGAFRRIVDKLREAKLTNFEIVFASSAQVKPGQFEEYDPGADYYGWVGYSWWNLGSDRQPAGDKASTDALPALEFARKVGKPVFIAEASAKKFYFDKQEGKEVWDQWFEALFRHIEENKDIVRAVSYINADWDSQDMWDGWGQTRIDTDAYVKQKWQEKMADPMFINADDNPFKIIGFEPAK